MRRMVCISLCLRVRKCWFQIVDIWYLQVYMQHGRQMQHLGWLYTMIASLSFRSRIGLRESWMVFRWSCKLLILLKWALMLLEAALCELCNGDLSNYWFNVYRSWNLELALIYDNGLVLFTFRTSWIVICWLYWVI